jgi:ribosomal protein S18 acetylase RimI-like enzyme
MPDITIVDATHVDTAILHATFTQAFADYLIGPFEVPLALWPAFLGRQGVDVALSRVALQGDTPVAFCLTAPRPECNSWRLGTMGALPAARGTGAAAALLADFIVRAQAARLASVELECFAQNTRALRLYETRGFKTIDALYGYQSTAPAQANAVDAPRVIGLDQAFAWLDASVAGGCALPLQVTPRSLRALTVPLTAWQQGSAQLVFCETADGGIQVNSLVDREPAQGSATALVRALLAQYPGRVIRVPQLQRQAVGGAALEELGFTRLPLHQLWMRRVL